MLYLKDNYFLERELSKDDIKDRILGHWGTVPGLNFIYAGLAYAAKKYNQEMLLITGPGHGAPAILSNTFLEGTLSEFYPEYSFDAEGIKKLIKNFSWPGGFPSHTSAEVPGTIHEGGELGYSLATAFGAAFDNPNLLVPCVIGDGEAETATLAASWHGNKFLNPEKDGAVLPILHLNGYRISGPTIFSSMSEGEIICYFKGLGYNPIIVDQYSSIDIYIDFLEALITAFEKILHIKSNWQTYSIAKPEWPIIILKTKKGWTGPTEVNDIKIEDTNMSHGIPLQKPKKNDNEFNALKSWLESYKVSELIEGGKPLSDILGFFPKGEIRISANKNAYSKKESLKLPNLEDLGAEVFERGQKMESRMVELSEYIREIFREPDNQFRFFSPDESESNLLEDTFDSTNRVYLWPLKQDEKHFAKDGKIVEMLSENVLQAMLTGYTLTGRSGILISYEAFLNIISSQVDQHIKYLKHSQKVAFRKPIPGLNLIATSTLWRQEHNGFTHQNPSLINSLLCKDLDLVRVYLPADVNTLLASMQQCLASENKVNLIVACKRELPQWITIEEAIEHVKRGFGIWKWVEDENLIANEELYKRKYGTEIPKEGTEDSKEVDVVLMSSGDYQTNETIAAIRILEDKIPEIKVRYINVNELNTFRKFLHNSDNSIISEYFTENKTIVFNFHGYPDAIKQITWGTQIANRMKILGYMEEGTTTTPFDMEVLNKASRIDVCIETLKAIRETKPELALKCEELVLQFENKLREHSQFIVENGYDMEMNF
jgi:xylulose-5-phosphate/fructose-6-phosphate phosphoketolase